MYIDIFTKSKIVVLDNYFKHDSLKEEILYPLESFVDAQNKSTNVKATMTHWDITSPQIEVLKSYVLSKSYELLWDGAKPSISQVWANIYRKNEYTILHDHVPSTLSFVYFLNSKIYYSSLYFDTIFGKKRIRPKEGRLVLFPSYLRHGVLKHKYNDTRITLSGNIKL